MSNYSSVFWMRYQNDPCIALKRSAFLEGPNAFLPLLEAEGDIIWKTLQSHEILP